jgi:L-aminopeptidase/D-esterase-like protein
MQPGEFNAITDVPGVRVGHTTLIQGVGKLRPGAGPIRTGVTAVLQHPGNLFQEKVPAAIYVINGFGKCMGREQVDELGVIDSPIMLTNTTNVGRVIDAVVAYSIRENPSMGITTFTVAFSNAESARVPAAPSGLTRQTEVVVDEEWTMDPLFQATVEATEEAIVNAMFKATTMAGRDDHVREALPLERVEAILSKAGRLFR